MQRYDLLAAAAPALRRLRASGGQAHDRNVPMTAVGALVAGLLLSVSFLAATESRVPAEQAGAVPAEVELESPDSVVVEPGGAEIDRERESDGYAEQLDDRAVRITEVRDSDDDSGIRWFNSRPIRPAGTITMLVTAYSPDERSCGEWADGITASGYSVWTNGMKLVAADTSILPFGSLVSIPGYDEGAVVPVLDRGGAIKGNRLDVLYPTHERALEWGVQRLEVTVWEYADGEPNGFRQQHHRWR